MKIIDLHQPCQHINTSQQDIDSIKSALEELIEETKQEGTKEFYTSMLYYITSLENEVEHLDSELEKHRFVK